MNKEIEKLAKELYKIRTIGEYDRDLYQFKKWEDLSRPVQLSWTNVSSYVQRLLIEARIDTVNTLNRRYKTRDIYIKSLRKQLSEIGEKE